MNPPESFGAWLKQRRKILDLTQEELAHRVGCSVSAIRKIEADERRPSRQVTNLLAAALEIPAAEQALFVKVARGERSYERLSALSEPFPSPRLEAPAPKEITAPASNLPIPATPIIGREREIQEVTHLLSHPECRLLTLTGPGGVGKTRLALSAAQSLLAQPETLFSGGIFFVSLAPVDSPDFIVAAIADAIGLSFYGSSSLQTQLLAYLQDKALLLVLDNFEHLLDGAGLLTQIFQSASQVKMLVTSRERLNLIGLEWVFEIFGLPTPTGSLQKGSSPTNLENSSALNLFLQSARRVRPSFEILDSNRADVIHICRLMDGIPLGIELAASWVRVLSCHEIVREIEASFDFLAAKARDLPERHRSLRAAFDHSWNLLSLAEQQVLQRLSVFRGGFHREAAQAVAGATLSELLALVDKSLLRPAVSSLETSQAGQYDMLEVVRQYAYQKLEASEALEETRQLHLKYYLSWVEQTEPKLWGPEQAAWLDRLSQEYNNLRAALEWSQIGSDCSELGLRLAASLWRFWSVRCYFVEGREWLRITRQKSCEVPLIYHAKALNGEALLAWRQGEDREARLLAEESAQLHQQEGNSRGQAYAQSLLGLILAAEGHFGHARALVEESIALFRQEQDSIGLGLALNSLGELARSEGKNEEAGALYMESLTIFRQLGHQRGVADLLHNLGYVSFHAGQLEKALSLFQESLEMEKAQRNRRGIAECWIGMATVMGAQGETRRAVQGFAAAASLMASLGSVLEPTDQTEYQKGLLEIQAQMTPEEFAQAWQSGQALAQEDEIEKILGLRT